MLCEAEKMTCQEWVETLRLAAKAQGYQGSLLYEECSMETSEEKWGVVGTELGVMYQYIADMRAQSFQNTSGLPEVSLRDWGLDTGLVTTRQLFDQTDCAPLFQRGDDEPPLLGTIGVRN